MCLGTAQHRWDGVKATKASVTNATYGAQPTLYVK